MAGAMADAMADAQGSLEAGGALPSDDDSESCPICLNAFRGQVVGTPQSCAHYFCLDCILEWSKVRWLPSGPSSPGTAPAVCRGPACGRPLAGQLCSVAGADHTVVLTRSPASLAPRLWVTHPAWGLSGPCPSGTCLQTLDDSIRQPVRVARSAPAASVGTECVAVCSTLIPGGQPGQGPSWGQAAGARRQAAQGR